MQKEMEKEEKDCRRLELRFIKSFKYKHKKKPSSKKLNNNNEKTTTSCDMITIQRLLAKRMIFIILLAVSLSTSSLIEAYCPFKCVCNDQLLSANCSQVSTISIVPMTLNPLLKHMTLNYLPIAELSNSLSVYRQLETLDLRSNQLRQISYQNFNFKPAPPSHSSITIHHNNSYAPIIAGTMNNTFVYTNHQLPSTNKFDLNQHNEQLAHHLRTSIDRFASSLSSPSDQLSQQDQTTTNHQGSASKDPAASSNNDNFSSEEIRFHLRFLDLSDNRIDQLGDLNGDDLINGNGYLTGAEDVPSLNNNDHHHQSEQPTSYYVVKRLKSQDLERQAPFLTLTRLELLNLSLNRLKHLHQHVFLGLINLKRLDLSKNQLEFIDKHAFVGLIELEILNLSSNKLAKHLNHLSIAFCRAPMNQLKHLDLSDNNNSVRKAASTSSPPASDYLQPGATATIDYDRDSILLLPNQMFLCSSKLKSLRLVNLQLRYIQVSAFDNLLQLEYLNLSKNNLEQVPSESLNYYGSNVSKTLKYLDLSETLIEFVNLKTFQSLEMLQILEMNSMPMLVSFDLAAFNFNNQTSTNNLLINEQLVELHLKNNRRLQSIHSSLSSSSYNNDNGDSHRKIKFLNLKQLLLEGNVELRELALEQMLDLNVPTTTTTTTTNGALLRVDLSYSNKLNCTSCQMSWLIESALNERSSALLEAQDNNKNWLPIPNRQTMMMMMMLNNINPSSHPYNNHQLYGQQQQDQQDSLTAPNNHYNQPMEALIKTPVRGMRTSSSKIHLSDPALIGCLWPYAMSLAELLDMNYNFAFIFDQCKEIKPFAATNNDYLQQLPVPVVASRNHHNQHHHHHLAPADGYENRSKSMTDGDDGLGQSLIYSTVAFVLVLVIGMVFVVTKRLFLYVKNQKRQAVNELKYKFKATTPIQMMMSPSNQDHHHNNGSGSSCSPGDCSTSSIISANQILINSSPFLNNNNQHHQLMVFNEKNNQPTSMTKELEKKLPGHKMFQQFQEQQQQQQQNKLLSSNFNSNSKSDRNDNNNNNNNNGYYLSQAGAEITAKRGNLFSRFVNQLSAYWRRSSYAESSSNSILTTTTADFIMAHHPQHHHQQQQQQHNVRVTTSSSSSSSPSTVAAAVYGNALGHRQQLLPPLPPSCKANENFEGVVYGGGCLSDKILPNNNINHEQPLYESTENLTNAAGHFANEAGGMVVENKQAASFLQDAALRGPFIYANCQQQQLALNERHQYQYQHQQQHQFEQPKTLFSGYNISDHNNPTRLGAISYEIMGPLAGYETCQDLMPSQLKTTTTASGVACSQTKHSSAAAISSATKTITNELASAYLKGASNFSENPFQKQQAILSPDQQEAAAAANPTSYGQQLEASSSFLVDGHIYVTLDGPIKQNVSSSEHEYSFGGGRSVYERKGQPGEQKASSFVETLRKRDEQEQEEEGVLLDGPSFALNQQNSSRRRNGNKIVEQDYKSFEWAPPSAVDFRATSSPPVRHHQSSDHFGPLKSKTPHFSGAPFTATAFAPDNNGAHNKATNKFKLASNGNNDHDNRSCNKNNQTSTETTRARRLLRASVGQEAPEEGAQVYMSGAKLSSSKPFEEMDNNNNNNISSFQQTKEAFEGNKRISCFPNVASGMNEENKSDFGETFKETSSIRNVIDRFANITTEANNLELFSHSQQPSAAAAANGTRSGQLSFMENKNLNVSSLSNNKTPTSKLAGGILMEEKRLFQNRYDDANDDPQQHRRATTTDDSDYVINGLNSSQNNIRSEEWQKKNHRHSKYKSGNRQHNSAMLASARGELFEGAAMGVTAKDNYHQQQTTAAADVGDKERKTRGALELELGLEEQEVHLARAEKNISSKEKFNSIDMIGQQNFTTTTSSSHAAGLTNVRPQSHHLTSSNRDYVDQRHQTQQRQVKQKEEQQNCDSTTTTAKDFKPSTSRTFGTINNNNREEETLHQQRNNTDLEGPLTVGGYNASNNNGDGKSSPFSGRNEIYSNQFYYCKPQSTATLSRTHNNNKLK